ncbi:MAG: FecCD family ABC transporter permease [Jeotgalicoccus sp.]
MSKTKVISIYLVSIVMLLFFMLLGLTTGDIDIPMKAIIKIPFGTEDNDLVYTMMYYRLPRILMAVLVGAALAVAGTIMQAVLKNHLAAPDTLGVSGGCAVFALVGTALFPTLSSIGMTGLSFLGGLSVVALTYLLAFKNEVSKVALALIGVSISALCSSIIKLTLLSSPGSLQSSLLWMNGSLYAHDWVKVVMVLTILLPITAGIFMVHKQLDILFTNVKLAIGVGIQVKFITIVLILLSSLLTAISVSTIGLISFVGLISPHISRMFFKSRHLHILPFSLIVGSNLLLISDIIGQKLFGNVNLPAGIVISIVGSLYFLVLILLEKINL